MTAGTAITKLRLLERWKILTLQGWKIRRKDHDDSARFARDETFCPQPGNSGEGYSFKSYNDPSMFIRPSNSIVFIASDGGMLQWDAPPGGTTTQAGRSPSRGADPRHAPPY